MYHQTDLSHTPSSTSLLFEEETYVRASTGKRFLNYGIDLVVFYIFWFFINNLLSVLLPETLYFLSGGTTFSLRYRLVVFVAYGLYMSVVEAVFKGKSLGKLITGTRAVNLDGSPISVGKAFGRGFSRAVPFCALSAFGDPPNPWQDRWTSTIVVERLSNINQA